MESILAKAMSSQQVRLLFGQNKLRYETSIFDHPRGNRGRIDIDFSSISNVHFDFEKSSADPKAGYKVTVQLSSPPSIYVGNQDFIQFRKTSAVYESQQHDFSDDSAVKKAKTHSFTVDNLNRLKTMKQRMEENGLADAIARGLDETLLTASFSEEEVEASFGKGRGKAAAKKSTTASKKRPAENAENDGNNNEATEDGAGPAEETAAAAAAPKAKPAQPKKPNPKAVPGLVDEMPEDAGLWLLKCVERWNLMAPFDPTIPDEMWESYYRERASLDWFIHEAEGLQVVWDDEMAYGKKEAKPTPEWTEEFPKPPMYAYASGERYQEFDTPKNHMESIGKALLKVTKGCPQLINDGAEDIGEKLAASIYVLNGFTNWVDSDCRTFDCQTRLYSPCGLGTAVDFKMRWHYRERMYSVEHFATVDFAVRTAEDIDHLAPQKCAVEDKYNPGSGKPSTRLFSMDEADSGYLKRTLVAANKMRAAEEALFGAKNVLSERKMFNALMYAATSVDCSCVNTDLQKNIAPFSRRKWKKFVGETGDDSDNDCDSDNEAKKRTKKSKKGQLKEMKQRSAQFGIPWEGSDGDDSDDDRDGERREECTIM
jgi:hypothetical protein